MKPEPKVLNIFEAILMLCDEIDGAYNMAECIRGSENTTAINQRILRINEEIENLYTLLLDVELGKAFRRSKLKIDTDKRSIYLQEIALMLFDLRKKLSDEHYAESFKNFQKVDDLIMKEIDLLIAPTLEPPPIFPQKLPDVEFIQGIRKEGFGTEIDVTNKKVRHYFSVEKEGEIRKYEPVEFLDLVLECYYNAFDRSNTYNERMSCLVNAKVTLKRYIRKHKLSALGYDFTELFEDLKDVTEQLEANKKLGFIQDKSLENDLSESESTEEGKKITTGEDILHIIDRYNISRENEIQKGGNLDIGKIEEMKLLLKLFAEMTNESEFDFSWFIVNLSRLRIHGAFPSIEAAKDAIAGFQTLKVNVPQYVINCQNELIARIKFVKKIVSEKLYLWNEDRIMQYEAWLSNQIAAYAFDRTSEVKFLTEQFDKAVKEIKETEVKIEREYRYYFSVYQGEKFTANEEDLNDFFFHCEGEKVNCSEFRVIFLALYPYFDNHNKISILKKLIADPSTSYLQKVKDDGQTSLTTLQYALLHYYKQEGKYEPIFESNGNITKREAINKQGEVYGVGGDSFAIQYYLIASKKQKKRITRGNIANLKKVIEFLADFPEGKTIAEKELKEAELLPY